MTLDTEKHCQPIVIRWVAAILLLFFCGTAFSCSFLPTSYRKTPQKLIRDTTTASHYRKKIGITAISNLSFIKNQELEKLFEQVMLDAIKSECKNALIVTPQDSDASDFLAMLPTKEDHTIDNFVLSNVARKEGYNAVVTGALATITARKERKGIWWWRKTHHYIQILAIIDVYDTYDAAKSFSDSILTEFEVDGADADKIADGQQIELAAIHQHIEQMAAEAGNSICAATGSRIWKGFVINASDKQVTLSCGEAQGIRTGNQFEVYDSSRTIDGADGQKFYVPGFKIGEIEISQVSRTQSEAKVITEKPLPVGSVVIPKS